MTTKNLKPLVFRNKNYVKRNYECSNIVACELLGSVWPDSNYVTADESILEKLTPLYIENNIRYWGHL